LNWGLTEEDLKSITPAEMRVFGPKANNDQADYGLSQRRGDPTEPENFFTAANFRNYKVRQVLTSETSGWKTGRK
jgi:hypothetical protein